MLTADELFPQRATVHMMRAAFEHNPRAVAQLILRDSGLTRRLDRKQLEHLSRIAGCR